MDNGIKRCVCVWHRRAGKDMTCINRTILEAMRRPANYYHCLPIYNQGRKAVWDGKDYSGRAFLDCFPKEIIKRKNNTDMVIELTSGSQWQVVGADNIDRIVGVNLGGVVFSEWSLMNPLAYDFLRPVLRENDAWAIFIYTPRGKNHGWDLFKMAEGNPDWYAEVLTIEDTGALTMADVEADRREGMDESLVQQEYFCSFSAAALGSYYGALMDAAVKEGRITLVPHTPANQVHTAWDLGYDDSTAIWFFQFVHGYARVLHYLENHGEGLPWYALKLKELASQRSWNYGKHFGPHDLEAHDISTGRTRKSVASDLGLQFTVIPRIKEQREGIEAVRAVIPQCIFDEVGCKQGIRCLESYHQEYDHEIKKWSDKPEHDWSSHGAKAFESLAFGLKRLASSAGDITQDDVKALYLRNAPPSVREAYGR
jgi:hypothetical protein